MKITEIDQLQENSTYYFATYYNSNIEGQRNGVFIYSCIYKNCTKEQIDKYGFDSTNGILHLYVNKELVHSGMCYQGVSEVGMLMEPKWIYNKKKQFFTTLIEAKYRAIVLSFTDYKYN